MKTFNEIQKVTTKGLIIKDGQAFMIRDQAGLGIS
jgi:hypothetical protein